MIQEQYIENSPIEEEQINQQDQQSDELSYNLKRKKNIRKSKKKRGRSLPNHPSNRISLITEFYNQNAHLFQLDRQTLYEKLSEKMGSGPSSQQIVKEFSKNVAGFRQADCKQETWQYLNFLRDIKTNLYEQVGIRLKAKAFVLPYLRKLTHNTANLKDVRFLSYTEDYLYKSRPILGEQISKYLCEVAEGLGYDPEECKVKDIRKQILILCKISNAFEKQSKRRLKAILEREERVKQISDNWQVSSEAQNNYIQLLMIKNLQKAFGEDPIDFYNYYRAVEVYDNNGYEPTYFEPIKTFAAFKKFLIAKKPKRHKGNRFTIKTTCSACFSDFSEMSNPIRKCIECPIRVHRYCQKIVTRCHRCRFARTSIEEKSQTGYCYICERPPEKGLMNHVITYQSPHRFAHNYCLLIHNLWSIETGLFKGKYVEQMQNRRYCKICLKNVGILKNCKKCGDVFHGICGYLEGYSFRINRNGEVKGYQVQVSCCESNQLRERLEFERKFKLNYNKILFKEDQQGHKQLFKYIRKVKQASSLTN